MSKSKKVQNVKKFGATLVLQVTPYRFVHGWFDHNTYSYHIAAFFDGQSPDYHNEHATVEEFETELRELGNLRKWGQRFI